MKFIVLFLSCILACSVSHADPTLPKIFSDSLVLQQNFNTPVWGWANAGEKITVKGSWPGAVATSAVADKNGNWKTKIKTPKAGGPYSVSIKGNSEVLLKGVLIGEVWLCGGQSNMEMPVKGWGEEIIAGSAEAIASSKNNRIRLFTVTKKIAYAKENDVAGEWKSAHPASVAEFSATGYFFGKELFDKLKVPIGLISSNWGGTVAEAWTDNTTLHSFTDFDKALKDVEAFSAKKDSIEAAYKPLYAKWQIDSADLNKDYTTGMLDADWKEMQLPVLWENAGLPDFDGVVWFVKEIDLPATLSGKDLTLSLGTIDDGDISFVNGQQVGSMGNSGFYNTARNYKVAASVLKPGKNIIAVKVTDLGGGGGIYGNENAMKLYETANEKNSISLAGNWKYKATATKASTGPSNNPNIPTVLYNGMIAPIAPYGIKGAIWYQGESNASRALQYQTLFPAMIRSWRSSFEQPRMPFYFVQIAPWSYGGQNVFGAELRDAQRRTLRLPQTGMAVTSDIGSLKTIHPANKTDVGKRLAYWALNKTYGRTTTAFSGPLFKAVNFVNGKAVVSFHYANGLTTRGKELKGFEIAGADKVYKTATAKIVGNTIEVASGEVNEPRFVRYNWHDTVTYDFFNAAGLPASTFTSEY